MEQYERPWQVLPAKIIELALEHEKKDSDFDHQVSFLMLDIGVETALKVYLTNKKQDIEKINFFELLEKTKEFALKDGISLKLDDVLYFHKVRNKLYHQGDGVKPTEDNIKRYAVLAQEILKTFIDVDLSARQSEQQAKKRYKRQTMGLMKAQNKRQKQAEQKKKQVIKSTIDEYIQVLQAELAYFQENCAVIIEQLHPSYITHQFALKYENISSEWPKRNPESWLDDDPEMVVQLAKQSIENQKQRLEKFNDLTEKNLENSDLVEILLKDINHLLVCLALGEVSNNWDEDWKKYLHVYDELVYIPLIPPSPCRMLERLQSGADSVCITSEQQVFSECQEIYVWLASQCKMTGTWINAHVKDVSRTGNGYVDLFFMLGRE